MATYSTTDKPPVSCNVFSQTDGGPITATFACGCVISDIHPRIGKMFYRCKCGETQFYMKTECVVCNSVQSDIENELKRYEFALRNEVHVAPWVRRIKSLLDIALSPRTHL